jgi:hypothetical protein
VALSAGADPGAVLRDLEQLLEDINPRAPYTFRGIDSHRQRLAKSDAKRAAGASEDTWADQERAEDLRFVTAHDAWKAKRDGAYAALRNLGGTVREVDAKDTQDDDE